ncbi:MAG: hypothetical protein K6F41_03110 [Lachnospira sp.]|nr:hypothetical protein [Lachnospira sp.]
MAGTIIYIVLFLLVSLIFVQMGIGQYNAKEPVTINSGDIKRSQKKLMMKKKVSV